MSEKARGLRFALARVTIELRTPLTIGTGGGDDTRDATCVVDADGLPAIPATSLAGVLRHALAGEGDPDKHADCRRIFGYQDGKLGDSSIVELSWGQVHDSQNRPVPFRGADLSDPVLAFMVDGVLRDHVRIDPRGVADGAGKFDETLVPAGARFTFEILVHERDSDAMADLLRLLTLLGDPALRLGGRTRRGFGAITVTRVAMRSFDLRAEADRSAWLDLPRRLDQGDPRGILQMLTLPAGVPSGKVRATLTLTPKDHWLFGGGAPVRDEHFRKDRGQPTEHAHDRLPVTERRIAWTADRGAMSDFEHLVPASGIKGALRHRVAFHARRLRKDWADPALEGWPDLSQSRGYTPEEDWLFGKVKARADGAGEDSAPGRLFLSDAYRGDLVYAAAVEHVSLDRFTQGPMDGLLFSEAPLYGGALVVEVDIDTRPGGAPGEARRALVSALADLCEGRLALGAGGSKGHGTFDGSVTWSDSGRWIGGER